MGAIFDNRYKTSLFLLLFFVLAVRLYPIASNLPHIYWHDEKNYIETALRFGSGTFMPYNLSHGGFFYIILFFVFAIYYVIGVLIGIFNSPLAFYLSYLKDPSVLFLIGRAVVVLSSVFMIMLVYKSARLLCHEVVAFVASFFTAFTLLSSQLSSVAHADMMAVMIMLLSFYVGLKGALNDRNSRIRIASLLVGIASATKYYCIFGFSFIVAFELYRHIFRKGITKKEIWNVAKNIMIDAVILFAAFVAGAPFVLMNLEMFYRGTVIVLGKGLITGHTETFPFLFHLRYHLRNGFGLPFELLIILGTLFGLIKRKKTYIFTSIFILTYYIVLSQEVGFCHHLLPIVPFAAIIVAQFLYDVVLSVRWKFRSLLYLSISFFVIMPTLMDSLKLTLIMPKQDTRTIAKEWVESNISPDSSIAMEGCVQEDIILGPPILQNEKSIQRDIATVKSKGGSARTYYILLDNYAVLNSASRYDIYKYIYLKSYDQIDHIDPDYIVTSGYNDIDRGEHSYMLPKDYIENRKMVKKWIYQHYDKIQEFHPTVNFSLQSPICMMNQDYAILRSLKWREIKNFVNGPIIKIYKRKS